MNFNRRSPRLLEPLLWPTAGLYALLMKSRNFAFEQGWLASFDVGVPVVSVGNITAGGTGKTPLTAFLVEKLLSEGKRVGIVSRGYGGQEIGPIRVPAQNGSASRFGDEPIWLAMNFPMVPVVIGADRVAAVQFLLHEEKVDLILADDGFQHRRLKRNFDIVVLDSTEPEWHYREIPLGRLREGFSSLGRAHAVFITKTNLAEGKVLSWLRQRVKEVNPRALVIEMESVISGFQSLSDFVSDSFSRNGDRATAIPSIRKVFLVSGIGRPSTFESLVHLSLKAEILGHEIFPDHHAFTQEDWDRIEKKAQKLGADAIAITQKDAVKIQKLNTRSVVVVSCLETRPVLNSTGIEEFYEAIRRLPL